MLYTSEIKLIRQAVTCIKLWISIERVHKVIQFNQSA